MNRVSHVATHFPHIIQETLVSAGTIPWWKPHSTPHYPRRIEGTETKKSYTFLCGCQYSKLLLNVLLLMAVL